MELKKMKCPSCGAELDVPEDENQIKCKFCGSKVLIDDKATEVSRIKKAEVKAKKELDEQEFENRKKNDEYNDERKYKSNKGSGKIKTWSIIMIIVCLLFTFTAFKDGYILRGLVGVIQIAAFGYSLLLCLDILPEKVKNLHKIVFIGGLVLIIPFLAIGNSSSSSYKKEAESLKWSEYVLSEKLPEPKTLKGELHTDSAKSLSVDIMNVSKDEFNDYVSACKKKGFTIDIDNSSNSYSAKNEEGYKLSVYYYEYSKEYNIDLDAPKEDEPEETTTTTKPQTTEKNETTTTKKENNKGLRSDFKEAMDKYESFMDEYVKFMKKYQKNPSDMSLLSDYTSYLEKYTKAVEAFDKWESEDMNAAETKYYLEVQTRVIKKLSEIQ